jgi:hypothetical protein
MNSPPNEIITIAMGCKVPNIENTKTLIENL